MAFKPNYNFQKAERNRAKALKKQEKLKRLQDESAKRKSGLSGEPDAAAATDVDGDAAAAPDADATAEPATSSDDA